MLTAEQLGLDDIEYNLFKETLDLLESEELTSALQADSVHCSSCGKKINPIRIAICPSTSVCSTCAQAGIGQPVVQKAIMIYDHKTGGELCFMNEAAWKETKRLTDRKGQMSILRKVSPSRD